MKQYQAVIFDLDGVICFTDHYHYLAWKRLADQEGIYFDETINNRLRGVSRMESLAIVLERATKGYTESEKRAMAEQKNEEYRTLLHQMSPSDLSESTKKTLEMLRANGVKLAIGSSSKNAPFILERIGLGDFFDVISDGNNIKHSKPHPEVFLQAADMLGLAPADCLVVEDAQAGVEAAIAGGFDSAAIGDAVLCHKATHEMSEFIDLLKIVR